MTRAGIVLFQQRRLRDLLQHAYHRVPYYRRLFDEAGVGPEQVRTLDDIRLIPISTRHDIQSLAPDRICAEGLKPEALRAVTTSGSTGMPLTVRRTLGEERLLLAYRARAAGAYGLGPATRRVQIDYFSPETLRTEGQLQPYERLGIMPRLLLDWKTPKSEILAAVDQFRPDILSGPPSVLSWLADDYSDEDRRRMGFRLTITGAETLTARMRQQIERGFGAPVADLYGSHEVVFIAMQRPQTDYYRVCEEAVLLEVLRDGVPAGPGESGEVVVTALHSFAMPFVRYRLGDVVTMGDAPGVREPYTTIRSIKGRSVDRFLLADGRSLHAYTLGDAIQGSQEVRRFQVVQEERDRFLVRLVMYRESAEITGRISAALRESLGAEVRVDFEIVDSLEPAGGRKFQTYVPCERLPASVR